MLEHYQIHMPKLNNIMLSSHTKSESLAEISISMAKIQNFFSRGLFFIGAPCRNAWKSLAYSTLSISVDP